MGIAEKIVENIRTLPESKQVEVLYFIEYLKLKAEKDERMAWESFSISSAMAGMEDEDSPYSLNDLKDTFS